MNNKINNITIRIATESDWPKIIEIYNQSIHELGKTADTEPQSVTSREDWLKNHLSPKHPILLAEIESIVVGWCSLSPHRPGRKALERTQEISYYIDADYRGKGVGSTIIRETISYAKKNEIKNLFAILLDINTQSIAILEKFGFERWGHLPKVADINGNVCGQLIYGKHI